MDILEKIRSGEQLTSEEYVKVASMLPDELQQLRQNDPAKYLELLKVLVTFIDDFKAAQKA